MVRVLNGESCVSGLQAIPETIQNIDSGAEASKEQGKAGSNWACWFTIQIHYEWYCFWFLFHMFPMLVLYMFYFYFANPIKCYQDSTAICVNNDFHLGLLWKGFLYFCLGSLVSICKLQCSEHHFIYRWLHANMFFLIHFPSELYFIGDLDRLDMATRQKLADLLDPVQAGSDWIALATWLSMSSEIDEIRDDSNPTLSLLERLEVRSSICLVCLISFAYRWLCARLQYLHCINTGDTAVLH